MKETFTPLGSTILVKPDPEDTTLDSGIILKSADKYIPVTGKIVAVSEGVADRYPEIAVGKQVLYKKFGPVEIELNDEEYLIVNILDVMGLI